MEIEIYRQKIANWVAQKLDRFFAPKPVSTPPESLSKEGQNVWAQTIDQAAGIVERFDLSQLDEKDIALLTSNLHARKIEEKLVSSKDIGTLLVVKSYVTSTPSRYLDLFAQEEGWGLDNREVWGRVNIWHMSIEELGRLMFQTVTTNEEIEKQRKTVVKMRQNLNRAAKIPSGLPTPAGE